MVSLTLVTNDLFAVWLIHTKPYKIFKSFSSIFQRNLHGNFFLIVSMEERSFSVKYHYEIIFNNRKTTIILNKLRLEWIFQCSSFHRFAQESDWKLPFFLLPSLTQVQRIVLLKKAISFLLTFICWLLSKLPSHGHCFWFVFCVIMCLLF